MPPGVLPEIVDTDDVGVVQHSQDLGLRDEALDEGRPDHCRPPTAVTTNVVEQDKADVRGDL